MKRLEDPRLLRGRGRYLDDVVLPRLLAVAFVRSPHAHAGLAAIEASAARAMPGVAAVITAAELRGLVRPLAPRLAGPGFTPSAWPALAERAVQFCGAAVVADSPYAAADACEGVRVEYEPRPAVTDIDGALAAERVVFRRAYRHGDVDAVFAAAPIQLRERFTHGRCVAAPLEPRGVLADWDGETLTVWSSTQIPSALRSTLAASLGLQETHVRVIAPTWAAASGSRRTSSPRSWRWPRWRVSSAAR